MPNQLLVRMRETEQIRAWEDPNEPSHALNELIENLKEFMMVHKVEVRTNRPQALAAS